jgi:putative ABC transport system substrate-binding protein
LGFRHEATNISRVEWRHGCMAAAAIAQPTDAMRTIGVFMNIAADDPESVARMAAFHQGLRELGWVDGRNVKTVYRWGPSDANRTRKYAAELVALGPDVLLTQTSLGIATLLEATRTVPIVFTIVSDPVAAGYVKSLAHPGGNATGFTNYEYSLAGKWLELLKQIAPDVTRVAVLRDPSVAAGPGQFAPIQAAGSLLGVDVRAVDVHDFGSVERDISAFAVSPNAGLIVTGSPQVTANRARIIALAAKYRLPAVYNIKVFAKDGGLLSYGSDNVTEFRNAADYVSRILKGEKPGELPVQVPTKYELVINFETAKALGLTVPQSMLATADEIIE